MPTSKKPRKKGTFGRAQEARRRLARNDFKSPAEARRLVQTVEESREKFRGGYARIGYMLALADRDFMVSRFIEAFMALSRWHTTREAADFSAVASMLMIGAIAFKKVGVQEEERLEEIRLAARNCTVAASHRNHMRRIPESLIDETRDGLTTAQMIFEAATESGMNEGLIETLKENDPVHVASIPGRARDHRRLLLGRHIAEVERLEREDDEFIKQMEITGQLPPPVQEENE